ncbi:hypothetical protein PAPYR_9266 [Paratrimastix pyriformis]|uniref:Uncharacterized protein n=1 Tax=Paratrimastix pyriformis TaxID=342808 RepID=A0ABQ8U8S7_9EUKA|nr:hypothetical protein PAPYR_9266 [Paratrimastix pyriformis]
MLLAQLAEAQARLQADQTLVEEAQRKADAAAAAAKESNPAAAGSLGTLGSLVDTRGLNEAQMAVVSERWAAAQQKIDSLVRQASAELEARERACKEREDLLERMLAEASGDVEDPDEPPAPRLSIPGTHPDSPMPPHTPTTPSTTTLTDPYLSLPPARAARQRRAGVNPPESESGAVLGPTPSARPISDLHGLDQGPLGGDSES